MAMIGRLAPERSAAIASRTWWASAQPSSSPSSPCRARGKRFCGAGTSASSRTRSPSPLTLPSPPTNGGEGRVRLTLPSPPLVGGEGRVRGEGERVRLLALVPAPQNRFPRARHGELGLDEGWALAHHVREAIAADRSGARRPIIAIVDLQSPAYGRMEPLLGIHLSLAAAADAYATARMAGHPVVALIVGTALSGGILGHGDQAHRLLALDDPQVMVQAMRKQSAARITRRTVEE